MPNKYKYTITLTPVDKFFFGGDMTFQVGNNEEDEFNTQYSSYIIQSSRFPQQTSLLGMLRFLILRNAGVSIFANNRITDKVAAAGLIGGRSFVVNNSNEPNIDGIYEQDSFGKIKSISHVRILRGGKELEFAPLFGSLESIGSQNGTYNFGQLKVYDITKDQYYAKDGLETLLIPTSDYHTFFNDYFSIMKKRKDIKEKIKEKVKKDEDLPRPPYLLGDIFIEDRRIGISRNIISGKTDDGALFKQISWRFNNKVVEHCFVFDAIVEDIDLTDNKYNGQLVSVGADNSQFILRVIKKEEVKEAVNQDNKVYDGATAVILLSPAFLKRSEVRDNTIFAVTQLMPFRFLESVMAKTESYHILSRNLTRSARYELYAPGTVFYLGNYGQRKAFIKALNAKQDFRQIGYNEYKTIK